MVNISQWASGFPETVKTYLEDQYARQITVKILGYVCERGNRCYLVTDKTIFHPRSGGQVDDTGMIIGEEFELLVQKVLEVGGVVVHYGKLTGGLPANGGEVLLKIDWGRRYATMRAHTAGHILDYAVMQTYGDLLNTLSALHGPGESFIEYGGSPPDPDGLDKIAEVAERIVLEKRPVKAYWVAPGELSQRVYNAPNLGRLPPSPRYRVVEIVGVNAIPCTGTHVATTGEVGGLELIRVEKTGGGFKLVYKVS